ncbi:MAG: UDP-N-acetylmuramate dehydrogenase [Gammaproteobacteria bacterium]|jgi:UDP-N-acetylmuramate dehydrogenase|nr:UDP-N-acetylmuramate dehydrogenase [Gammaproteobacteria bacterium]MBT7369975.1 UDP-N-acetylmuramate dehydrogenase [Gammaproteobacteria bacterium]
MSLDIRENTPLQKRNSLRLKASARWYCEAHCLDDVIEAAEFARLKSIPVIPLGSGTNVVVLGDLNAVVVSIAIKGTEFSGREAIVGAGEDWHQFVGAALNQSLYGLENLALIPGTVGAAPVQNIGAYGVELGGWLNELVAVNTKTLETQVFSREDCLFDYRTSRFKDEAHWVITEVRFALSQTESPVIDYPGIDDYLSEHDLAPSSLSVFKAVTAIRQSKLPDPEVEPNAGSFFKNPVVSLEEARNLQAQFPQLPIFPVQDNGGSRKISAAWLIDHAGLKGRAVGDIKVSRKHALVIVNQGCGTAEQLLELISSIQSAVRDRYDLQLEPEPGFYP